jgi:hypothetical protein
VTAAEIRATRSPLDDVVALHSAEDAGGLAIEPKVAFCVLDDVAEVVDQAELAGPEIRLDSTPARDC